MNDRGNWGPADESNALPLSHQGGITAKRNPTEEKHKRNKQACTTVNLASNITIPIIPTDTPAQ